MLLVDKNIEVFVQNGNVTFPDDETNQTTIFYGDKSNITNIGYDLRVDKILKNKKELDTLDLSPGDSVFVSSIELIMFDTTTAGYVSLRNSRIRMGLDLTSPVYQPGHLTNIFFKLTNTSDSVITISHGEKYATLLFEQLNEEPNTSYDGTYQKEQVFTDLGGYESEYSKQIKIAEKKINNLEAIEKRLYGNVITILTIFIAIFSLLNVNISLAISNATTKSFFVYNLANLGAISFLVSLIDSILNRKKALHKLWIVPIVCFILLLIAVLL